MTEAKHKRSEKTGSVVGTKMAKTIVVEVTRRVPHPLYKRIMSKRKKYYAHDEGGEANLGDVVTIVECRPMSKLKRWQLQGVLRKAVQVTTDLSSIGIQAAPERRPAKSSKINKKRRKKKR